MSRSVVLLALLGCSPRLPLSEVPIVGADPEVEARIRDTLMAFERDTGGGRVALTEIRFKDIPISGRHDRATDRITLSPTTIASGSLESTVTHELCHALDFAEDLVARDPWDALADTMFDPKHGLVDPDASEEGPRGRRREAFAAWCELGALPAAMLTRSCGEPPAVIRAMAILARDVWTERPPFDSVEPPDGPIWSIDTGRRIDDFTVQQTMDPDIVRLVTGDWESGSATGIAVDLATGAVVRDPGPFGLAPHEDVPEGLPASFHLSGAESPWGSAATFVSFGWHYPGESATRLLWSGRDDEWLLVGDGCVDRRPTDLFAGPRDVWIAWAEDRMVRMRPVAAR